MKIWGGSSACNVRAAMPTAVQSCQDCSAFRLVHQDLVSGHLVRRNNCTKSGSGETQGGGLRGSHADHHDAVQSRNMAFTAPLTVLWSFTCSLPGK